jgi:phage gpG-like protein
MALIIEISDQAVQAAMNRLVAVTDPKAFLPVLGEEMVSRIKDRFATSKDPAGNAWAPNSPVTLALFLNKTSGNYNKDGKLSKKGQDRLANKKPLIGESHALSENIFHQMQGNDLIVGSNQKYATTQQYGALRGQFGVDRRNHPLPWGNIPARPFMPVLPNGELYPAERERILALLTAEIQGAFDGQQT